MVRFMCRPSGTKLIASVNNRNQSNLVHALKRKMDEFLGLQGLLSFIQVF